MAIGEAMVVTIHKKLQKIMIESDSQLVVNSINGKISVPKDAINLIEDIRVLSFCFIDFRIEYCDRSTNREADATRKCPELSFVGCFVSTLLCWYSIVFLSYQKKKKSSFDSKK